MTMLAFQSIGALRQPDRHTTHRNYDVPRRTDYASMLWNANIVITLAIYGEDKSSISEHRKITATRPTHNTLKLWCATCSVLTRLVLVGLMQFRALQKKVASYMKCLFPEGRSNNMCNSPSLQSCHMPCHISQNCGSSRANSWCFLLSIALPVITKKDVSFAHILNAPFLHFVLWQHCLSATTPLDKSNKCGGKTTTTCDIKAGGNPEGKGERGTIIYFQVSTWTRWCATWRPRSHRVTLALAMINKLTD